MLLRALANGELTCKTMKKGRDLVMSWRSWLCGGSEQQQRGRVRSEREKIPRKDGDRAKGKKGSNQRKKEMSKEKRGIVSVEGLAVMYIRTGKFATTVPL